MLLKKTSYAKLKCMFVLTCVMCTNVFANEVEHHTKAWGYLVMTGPLCDYNKVKYYFDAQLEFEDDRYKFEEAYSSVGIGYQVSPSLVLFLVNSYNITKRHNGNIEQEYRIWEEADWVIIDKKTYALANRIRLVERKNFQQPQIALRLREKITLSQPFANSTKYLLIISDEVFFNLNRPRWVAQTFFEQNRAFIGLGIKVSKQSLFSIGYMNQYQLTTPRQLSNILYVSLSVNAG